MVSACRVAVFGQRDNRPLLYPAVGGGSCAVHAEGLLERE